MLTTILSFLLSLVRSPSIVPTMSNNERTYIMIKPDGVQRNLVGAIISRFENRGFKIVALQMVTPSKEHLEKRTSFHRISNASMVYCCTTQNTSYALKTSAIFYSECPIFRRLRGPRQQALLPRPHQVHALRARNCYCRPRSRRCEDRSCHARCHQPSRLRSRSVHLCPFACSSNITVMVSGTIRGDYALAVGRNICHGSDSVESAEKEIALYVSPSSSCLYTHTTCPFSAGSPMVSRRMFLSPGLDYFLLIPRCRYEDVEYTWVHET